MRNLQAFNLDAENVGTFQSVYLHFYLFYIKLHLFYSINQGMISFAIDVHSYICLIVRRKLARPCICVKDGSLSQGSLVSHTTPLSNRPHSFLKNKPTMSVTQTRVTAPSFNRPLKQHALLCKHTFHSPCLIWATKEGISVSISARFSGHKIAAAE